MVNWLNRLRIRNKLLIIKIPIIIVLFYFVTLAIYDKYKINNNYNYIKTLAEFEGIISKTIQSLQKVRGLSLIYISSNATEPNQKLLSAREEAKVLINELQEEYYDKYKRLLYNNNSEEVEKLLSKIEVAFSSYNDIDNKKIIIDELVSHYSNLIIDLINITKPLQSSNSDLQIRNLSEQSVDLLELIERLGLLRGLVSSKILDIKLTEETNSYIKSLIVERDVYIKRLLTSSAGNVRMQVSDIIATKNHKNVNNILNIILNNNSLEASNLNENDYFNILTEEINLFGRVLQENLNAKISYAKNISLDAQKNLLFVFIFALASVSVSLILIYMINKQLLFSIKNIIQATISVNEGNYEASIFSNTKDEIGELSKNFNIMVLKLRETINQHNEARWLITGKSKLSMELRGEQSPAELAQRAIYFLVKYLEYHVCLLYIYNKQENKLKLVASYANDNELNNIKSEYELGESLIGQVALDKQEFIIKNPPSDYIKISSGLGDTAPSSIVLAPLLLNEEIFGVIELGGMHELSKIEMQLLYSSLEFIAVAINSANNRVETESLLERTKQQAEDLEQQQQKLEMSNQELEIQQQELEAYNRELKSQSAVLKESEDKLRAYNEKIETKNIQLEEAKSELERKANALEAANRYKSEFLANMSHELRTPLNSLLILSEVLLENRDKNLTKEQVESAEIIKSSGCDLLKLINEILDLSKIEAGRIEVVAKEVDLREVVEYLRRHFSAIAKTKNIEYVVEVDPMLPKKFMTDKDKLLQILKNLLSNAFKFTEHGVVKLQASIASEDEINNCKYLKTDKTAIVFKVEDTGIGVAPDKSKEIFGSFQQADGSISRKYGGTGLGLAISKQLSKLLNGEISLSSVKGKGSVFSLIITPIDSNEYSKIIENEVYEPNTSSTLMKFEDDKENISINDKSILFIEDDLNFAKILTDIARGKGYKSLVARSGASGLALAIKWQPNAIVLDIGLPDIDGLEVLKELKNHERTYCIPVHIISANDSSLFNNVQGAIGFLTKPAGLNDIDKIFDKLGEEYSNSIKNVLVIEDDVNSQKSICMLLNNSGLHTTVAVNASSASQMLKTIRFDCVILDLDLPDKDGLNLLKELSSNKDLILPPLIIYTGKELTKGEYNELRNYSSGIIVKGASAPDRLINEVGNFISAFSDREHRELNKVDSINKESNKSNNISKEYGEKTILIVDDDIRNIIALSKALVDRGYKIITADNGKTCLDKLESDKSIDLVLMDIMMPVMDGFEAMAKIRENNKFANLPIIALTAKAMPGDKEKCFESGANDYISKPINIPHLLELLRLHFSGKS